METDLNNLCEEKQQKQKDEMEEDHDAEIKRLTDSCKSQCDQNLH